jgi:hypothetical protein
MGARVQSLTIPGIQPSKKWIWLLAGFVALSLAAGAASFLALRGGPEQANAPAQSRIAQPGVPAGTGNGLIEVANASANLTGHSLVYFTAGSTAQQVGAYPSSSAVGGRGRALAELRGVDVIGISGTGPGLTQIAGNDSAKPQSSDTCRGVRRGPC